MTFGTPITKIPASVLSLALMMSVMGYVIAPDPAHADLTKRVYLTSGTSWTVPNDWTSSSNTIDAIGSGGDGSTSSAGGGGGAFARITNLSLTGGASVTYQIGAGSTDTVFNSTTVNCTVAPAPSVCGDGGADAAGAANGAGGTVANSVGTTEYAGGDAGAGGGGGAAGPGGAGGTGTGDGGTGGNGLGGGGGVASEVDVGVCLTNGGTGEGGAEYDTLPGHGSGGGGGIGSPVFPGSGNDCTPGNGGTYGGGGGGGTSENAASTGAPGLIVITYASTDTGSSSNAMIKIQGGKVQIMGGRVLIQ